MLSQYGKIVETIESPRDITYRAFFIYLKQAKDGYYQYTELCKIACEENKQVAEYLGNKFDMEHNRKIKPIIDMLLNNHGKNYQNSEDEAYGIRVYRRKRLSYCFCI